LVIHRDIKPGNILVNQEGRPKLLEFGVAKLLDEDSISAEEGLTQTGMWHLTPEYASPEQIKGQNITTSSDIYSLGVLLYQILS
jgi:serine/threonine protein kinase